MALTQSQKTLIEKTRSVGTARAAEPLSEDDCLFLVATIARDLGLIDRFPELSGDFPEFYEVGVRKRPAVGSLSFTEGFERLVSLAADADSYFACLGTLYKARLKYANILRLQPTPTIDQVGPRGLLQYGSFSASALTAFLLWRKWIFDIDNRAGQETGYLFEPIFAAAIGGTPASARKSPVRRAKDKTKGRQVDCLKGNFAYEFKIRVTIAASGQGRWAEEIDFATDCLDSGYTPVLLVLDPTPNPKLSALMEAFEGKGGRVFVGNNAWEHIDREAGPIMAIFIDKYVRSPISDLLAAVPEVLPTMTLDMANARFAVRFGNEEFSIDRRPSPELAEGEPDLPDDIEDQLPGV
jgi:hypothetical protein